ncbi:carbohydrate kinase family protein [Hymenobacter weizhouensis]|uniref:carbohydrate kinase family protein n=1 Tax=Hymenobacter sp. YIM 151500-1 TaxID=2987689 RepID=UPI0022260A21|nr:PfkB family carbohydrate kinase [Hymenobacter sp. YIM 151500-1]UYZ61429.1 PfkB family carbohydrate kinase [Hymenobacter sp. YIM 151500-1]
MVSAAPAPLPGSPVGLLAIGELLIDAISTQFVTDLSEATTLRVVAGGSPANLCRFVRCGGGAATLVAAVGQDGLGRRLLHAVAEAGLSTSHIQQLDDYATSIIVVARSQGTPEFIQYRDADRHLAAVSDDLVAQATVVHTTAFALSKTPARHAILAAFAAAHARNIPVSVDWNYAEAIWGRKNNAADVFHEVLSYAPLLKVSLDDVSRFTGRMQHAASAKLYLDATAPAARIVCLTCGAEGVWFRVGAYPWQHRPAHPVPAVVDTTGAGDAFWAGFLLCWMQQHPAEVCIDNALLTAARRLTGHL